VVVWDGMDSIMFHSTPLKLYKSKQWNMTSSHSITFYQSKHSLKKWVESHSIFGGYPPLE